MRLIHESFGMLQRITGRRYPRVEQFLLTANDETKHEFGRMMVDLSYELTVQRKEGRRDAMIRGKL